MLRKLLGIKVGMTQIFDEQQNVVPVTVIRVTDWYVTQIKTVENDGYAALQVGLVKKRYSALPFAPEWLQAKKKYFSHVREVRFEDEAATHDFAVGQAVTLDHSTLELKRCVDVTGISIGRGFQGVVKRHGFAGGPKSHGSTFHRIPGSSGNMRRQGEVLKGKRFPGHMGNKQITMRGLQVARIDKETGHLFVKGAVPGKTGTLLVISKQI